MKPTRTVRFFFLAVSIPLAGIAHAQTGQFFDEFGASAKSIALGQAFTAVADDFSAAYYNPAGLAQVKSPMEMTLGYFYAKPRAKATIESSPYRYDNDIPAQITEQRSSHGVIVGVASNMDVPSLIRAYPWFRRFSFGMVFWLNLPEILTYDTGPEPYRPHYFRYDEGFALMSMVGSAAFEITPWLSVGAGAFFSQKTYSRQEVYSAINYSNYLPFPLPGWVADEVIGSRLSIWSTAEAFVVPVVGVLFKAPVRSLQDRLSLGVSWRARNKAHHARGPLIANLGIEDPDVPGRPTDIGWPDFVNTYISSIVGFQPAQLTFALAGCPMKGLALAVDVTWKEYSEYVDYNDEVPDPSFENVIVPRFGIEYVCNPGFSSRWLGWIELIAFRGGYYFEPTPVKSSDESHNIFDTDQDVVSTGLEVVFSQMQGRLLHSVEAYFQVHLLRDRHIANDEDPFFGPADLSGEVWHVGGSMTTRF
jgi:long-chain fatty acid transport protein